MDAQFDELWRDRLEPWLASLEAERQRGAKEFWAWMAAACVAGLVAGAILAARSGDLLFLPVCVFLGVLVSWFAAGGRLDALRTRVKFGLNSCIAEACGLRYAFKPAAPVRFEVLKELGLLPAHSQRSFEDHFSGERQGCDFELYEAHLEKRHGSGASTQFATVFRGVLIRISFPRRVEGVTVITRDIGILNDWEALGRAFASRELQRIRLVDPQFESIFEVYGSDQVLARYMLDPAFMERLRRLEAALMGQNVRAVFDEHSGEGELLIAAETGNQFEIGSMFEPLADPARVRTVVHELTRVTEIIESLVKPPVLGEGG
ncbi:DUF3137 domain-containing protein [Maricaulis sp.]|uniref:DUF3137 domain-containing protein n=1 Tax=Maricaulis sp. TaxID=1486257 RepID=UPI003A9109DD